MFWRKIIKYKSNVSLDFALFYQWYSFDGIRIIWKSNNDLFYVYFSLHISFLAQINGNLKYDPIIDK